MAGQVSGGGKELRRSRREAVHVHRVPTLAVEEPAHDERHRATARGVPQAREGPGDAALGGVGLHALLGAAGLRQRCHEKGRRLSNDRQTPTGGNGAGRLNGQRSYDVIGSKRPISTTFGTRPLTTRRNTDQSDVTTRRYKETTQ